MAARDPREIIAAVYRAGVIGAGGGGFPTHLKLQARADTVIANGSECEPLLASDKTLLKENAARVVAGLELAMAACGAAAGVVAVKRSHPEVVETVRRELPPGGAVRLHLLDDYYPAGDEFLTVYDVTGRVVPEGGLPPDVGVLVCNVLSLAQVAHAVAGKPVTERPVTVAGSVRRPRVVDAPIGTPYADLVAAAGGTLRADDVLLDGGPLMGAPVADPSAGIGRTTAAVLALPADHLVVRLRQTDLGEMLRKSKAACCQCSRCTDLCPRYLLGHRLEPHRTMRTVDYGLADAEAVTAAFLCSQCGVCELLACDAMLLSPRRLLAEYKRALLARGVRNPLRRTPGAARPELADRRQPTAMARRKLGLEAFAAAPERGRFRAERVRLPLRRHAGAPARPRVAAGQAVQMGDLVAAPPDERSGACVHASIAGRVSEAGDEWLEIRA